MRKCVQAEQSEKPAKRFGLLKKIDIISLKEFFSYYDIRTAISLCYFYFLMLRT
jgi:hypothetical protein